MSARIIIGVFLISLLTAGCAGKESLLSAAALRQPETPPDNDSLPFELKYGQVALKLSPSIKTANCKQIYNAFIDSGSAVLELSDYLKKNKSKLSKEETKNLKLVTGRYLALTAKIHKEDKARCANR